MYRIIILFFLGVSMTHGQSQQSTDTTAFSVDLDQFVFTAQHKPTHYKKANHKISIITADELQQRAVVSLDQALLIHPSIRINVDPILGSTIRMRGMSGRNVAILVDGIPVIGRLNGNIDLSQINMNNVERIEIVEGALSNIYGNNAAGGVVNIITKKRQSGVWNPSLGTQIDGVGQQNLHGSLGFKKNNYTFKIHSRYFNYDQFSVDSLRVTEDIILDEGESLTQKKYPFNPKTQIGGGFLFSFVPNSKFNVLFKADLNKEQVQSYGVVKRPQYNPYSLDNTFNTTRTDFALNITKNIGNSILEINSGLNYYDRIYTSDRLYLETNEIDTMLSEADTTLFNSIFNRVVFSGAITKNLRGMIGFNLNQESGSGDRIINRGQEDSLNVSFLETSPFFELIHEIPKGLQTTLSGRYLIHSIYDSQFTYSILFKHTLGKHWITRLGFTQGYRSPSLKELHMEFIDINHYIIGNTDLNPERSKDFQFNMDYDNSKKPFSFAFNAFYTSLENRIGLIAFEDQKYRYDNIDEYNVFGFQPQVNINILKQLNWSNSATWSFWATSLDESSGPQYGDVLDFNSKLEYYSEKLKLNFLVNYRYTGRQLSYSYINDELRTSTIEGFNLMDFSISKKIKECLSITAGVTNLFDVSSVQVIGAATGNAHGGIGRSLIGLGRAPFLRLKFSLND